MKPVELVERASEEFQQDQGYWIASALARSHSHREQLGLQCRTSELDPKYVDVIVTRWQEVTGKQQHAGRKKLK